MHLIEKFIQGKALDPSLCEDAIVLTDDFAVVIDGASDKTGVRYDGLLGGRFAAQSVARTFASLPADATMCAAVALISNRLATELSQQGRSSSAPPPVAVFVAYSRHRQEVWRLGDGSWRNEQDTFRGTKKIDEITTQARVALVKSLLAEGKSVEDLRVVDPGWEMVLPLLRRQYHFKNMSTEDPLAYGVIDGNPVPARFCEQWKIHSGGEIILSSDGYPCLFKSLSETEDYLHHCLQMDPLCIHAHPSVHRWIPGNHSFDDRAYLRLKV